MLTDLRALPLETEDQVQPRVHRRELLHPDVLENPQHRELAGLIDDCVIGDDGEVEMHPLSVDYGRLMTENGTEARVFSHSSFSTPPLPFGSTAIVNCSTGCFRVSTFMSRRARSYWAS